MPIVKQTKILNNSGADTESHDGETEYEIDKESFFRGVSECPQDLSEEDIEFDNDSAIGDSIDSSKRSYSTYRHDDTSDEEDEGEEVKTLNIDSYPDPSKKTNLDIHHAYAIQDVALRILKSSPLRKAYFKVKPKYLSDREMSLDSAKLVLDKALKEMFASLYEDQGWLSQDIDKIKEQKAEEQKKHDQLKSDSPAKGNSRFI